MSISQEKSTRSTSTEHDEGSLMALQALLQFRTESKQLDTSEMLVHSQQLLSKTNVNATANTNLKLFPAAGVSQTANGSCSPPVAATASERITSVIADPAVPMSLSTMQHPVYPVAQPVYYNVLPGSTRPPAGVQGNNGPASPFVAPVRRGFPTHNMHAVAAAVQQQHGVMHPRMDHSPHYARFLTQNNAASPQRTSPEATPKHMKNLPMQQKSPKKQQRAANKAASPVSHSRKRRNAGATLKNYQSVPSTPSPKMTSSTHHHPPISLDMMSANEANVRKDEIEAALRSQPQRGRKRENLSSQERLELTRTRNREHAKSTRMRKKARYEELLDNEVKCKQFERLQILLVHRQNCVFQFLATRSHMLQGILELLSVNKCDEQETELKIPKEKSSEIFKNSNRGRSVSFLDRRGAVENETNSDKSPSPTLSAISSEGSSLLINHLTEQTSTLNDLVENITNFAFEQPMTSNLPSSSSDDARSSVCVSQQDVSALLKGVSAMKDFDDDLAYIVKEQYTNTPIVFYRLKGLQSGIAIGKEGAGFCGVEVIVRQDAASEGYNEQHEIIFQSAILKFQFAPDNSKLRAVEWYTVNNIPSSVQRAPSCLERKRSTQSSDYLSHQRSFPSVISLEQSHCMGG